MVQLHQLISRIPDINILKSPMLRQQALTRLQQLAIQCSQCKEEYPTYRIALATNQHTNLHTDNHTQFQQPQIRANHYICLTCLKHKKTLQHVANKTFYQVGLKLIKQIPLPEYGFANECLNLVKKTEQDLQQMEKRIMREIEACKFTIFKLCTETKKYCQEYIEKVSYFENIDFDACIRAQSGTGFQDSCWEKSEYGSFSINQSKKLTQIAQKINLMRSVNAEIHKTVISIPEIQQTIAKHLQRKIQKTKVCDVPVSAMANVNGRQFLGFADGRLIYESMSDFVSNQAHQSLIRSLAHDDQYTLYSGSDDFSIKAWDLHEHEIRCFRTFGKLESIKSYHRNMAIIGGGAALVTTRGQFDGFKLRIWNLDGDYQNTNAIKGHTAFIRDMIVASNDNIYTVSDDRTIKIWDTKTMKLLRSQMYLYRINSIMLNETLGLCAVIDQDNKVIIMAKDTLQIINGWSLPHKIIACKDHSKCCFRVREANIILAYAHVIAIWSWDGTKIYEVGIDPTFVPFMMMRVHEKLVIADGTGCILKVKVPHQFIHN